MTWRFSYATLVCLCMIFMFSIGCSSSRKSKQGEVKLSSEQRDLLKKYEKQVGSEIEGQHLALYKFIDAWWGVPHKIGGNDKSGIDCSAFIVRLYDEVYGKELARTSESMYASAKLIDTAKLVTGDLVFIAFQGRKKVSHVGVYLQEGKFVHASTSKGVRIDFMRDTYYRKQQFWGGRIR